MKIYRWFIALLLLISPMFLCGWMQPPASPVTTVASGATTVYGNSTTVVTNPNVPVTTYGSGGTIATNPSVPVTTYGGGGTIYLGAAISLTGSPAFSSVTVSGAVSTGTLNATGNSTLAGVSASSLTVSGAVSTGTLNVTGTSTNAAINATAVSVTSFINSGAMSIGGATSIVGNQFINGVETTLVPFADAVFWSPTMQRTNTTFNPATTTAYFVYIGEVESVFTPKYVRFFQSTAGTLSVNEVGIFTTTAAPNASSQTLTKVTSGVFAAGTGMIKNTSAFSTALTVGAHIWIGFNSTWSVQPVLNGLADDYGTGSYLTVASPTAFASGTSYSGVATTTMAALTGVCPDLVLTNN